jgi:CubicO group peptidase (beta-lactamase class C family)
VRYSRRPLAEAVSLVLLFTPSLAKTSKTLADKIDPIFARWNSTEKPGYAVGIIQNGEMVFAKGYGMANLEYGVPITADSPFYIGSMSKQFTAASVALLVQQGRLSLADDVRKYIPELPDYNSRITINELIHHTSGVRDWTSVALFSGFDSRFEDRLDNDDLLRLICHQRSLNFPPGTDFRYSSSGYILLTKIIERVSGQSFPAFASQHIFRPLGMEHTSVEDNYAEIVRNRVESYRAIGDHYERWLKHFNIYGDGGIVTTLNDLAKWDKNFYQDRVGEKGLVQMLLTRGRLSNQKEIHYAFGLELDTHNGYRVVKHNGGMLGFNVDMVRFPDEKLTVIVLGNSQDASVTGLAFDVADRLLPAKPASAPLANTIVPLTISFDAGELRKYEGAYAVREFNNRETIKLKNGQLRIEETGEILQPAGPARFMIAGDSGKVSDLRQEVRFESGDAGSMTMHFSSGAALGSFDADRYDPTPPSSIDQMRELVGEYRSDELETTYIFWIDKGELYLQLGRGKPIGLFPAHDDPRVEWNSLRKVWVGFGMITFIPGRDGKIEGLDIGDSRVKAIRFQKVKGASTRSVNKDRLKTTWSRGAGRWLTSSALSPDGRRFLIPVQPEVAAAPISLTLNWTGKLGK